MNTLPLVSRAAKSASRLRDSTLVFVEVMVSYEELRLLVEPLSLEAGSPTSSDVLVAIMVVEASEVANAS